MKARSRCRAARGSAISRRKRRAGPPLRSRPCSPPISSAPALMDEAEALHRSPSARRHSRSPARDRRLQRSGARRAHPARPRLRRRDAGPSARQLFRAAGRCAWRSPPCCSPQPDLLLLDEPSNHLDLEATLWLENFLKSYAGTLIVISHERDLLNNVVDTILHLEGGKITLYSGGYDSFERQRAERAAQLAAAQAAQDAQRARLQDYIARNSARASTAKQAQSRAKMLAKMQPIAALVEDPSLSFDFPSPSELKPPLITLDMAAVGYAGHARAAAAQPADRSRRPDRAARPQRQRQDHAGAAAGGAARADGRRASRRRARCGSATSPNTRSRNCTATTRRSST